MDLISIFLAASVPIILLGGLINRSLVTSETEKGNIVRGKGIGWQFIRFSVLTTSIPVIALLALNGTFDGDVAYALLAAGMGFAFGKKDD